jgi:hypothetical protein
MWHFEYYMKGTKDMLKFENEFPLVLIGEWIGRLKANFSLRNARVENLFGENRSRLWRLVQY